MKAREFIKIYLMPPPKTKQHKKKNSIAILGCCCHSDFNHYYATAPHAVTSSYPSKETENTLAHVTQSPLKAQSERDCSIKYCTCGLNMHSKTRKQEFLDSKKRSADPYGLLHHTG